MTEWVRWDSWIFGVGRTLVTTTFIVVDHYDSPVAIQFTFTSPLFGVSRMDYIIHFKVFPSVFNDIFKCYGKCGGR